MVGVGVGVVVGVAVVVAVGVVVVVGVVVAVGVVVVVAVVVAVVVGVGVAVVMTGPIGRNSQGRYAIEIGGKHVGPSTSTILKLIANDGLQWGAAKETALFAVHHQDEWQHLDDDAAYRKLLIRHQMVWDLKSDVGSLVHDLSETWASSKSVDIQNLVFNYSIEKNRRWNDQKQEEIVVRVHQFTDAVERFWEEKQPEFLQTERTSICPGINTYPDGHGINSYSSKFFDKGSCYAGTCDADVLIKGKRHRLDYKTGKRYPINVILQLASYDFAPYLGVYDDKGELMAYEENTRAEACSVLYFHDDGTYELLELPVDENAFNQFALLRMQKRWLSQQESWLRKHPESERDPVDE